MLQMHLNLEAMLAAGGEIVMGKSSDGKSDLRRLHYNRHILSVSSYAEVHLSFSEMDDHVPNDLLPFLLDFTFHDNFGYGFKSKRQLGQYRLDTAVADLSTAGDHYHNTLRAQKQQDLCELVMLVREGQIWPARDYGVEQVPPPFRHLKGALAEIWQLIRRDIRDRLYHIKERVINIAA